MASGKILISHHSVNLKMMLEGGQCFRWKGVSSNEWIGTALNVVWVLKQFDQSIEYEVILGSLEDCSFRPNEKYIVENSNKAKSILSSYLRLEEPVEKYYEEWSQKDANFEKVASKCYGIRILNQDPVENVFSFICSSNNNIKRISSLVEKLCTIYGPKLGEIDGIAYYGFPDISTLAEAKEDVLRKAGFGYRAKFICESAKQINSFGGVEWLHSLKNSSYAEAKSNLMKLTGVGAKVADCICLMSLGHMGALPVDTHVYQIASQVYMPHLAKIKSLTNRVYNEIGDFFCDLYGPLAGWAHTVLFCGDLKVFKDSDHPPLQTLNGPAKIKSNIKQGFECSSPQKKKKNSRSCKSFETHSVSGILKCSRRDLNLNLTFNSGQTYRFKELDTDVWRGVFANKVWTLKQYDDHIKFSAHFSNDILSNDEKYCTSLLHDYFRLDVPLEMHYRRWAECDKHFNDISKKFYGLRMIKQDIVENLFTFICSSCNTISRMTSMVDTMCRLYGNKIAEVDQTTYFDFPSVINLSKELVEQELIRHNFGYRAKYIQNAAKYIVQNGGNGWFDNLKKLSYVEAKSELMKLPGVAAKVADCICLTALDHLETIPVDTHVFQIAKRFYLPHLTGKKTISSKAYGEIQNCFQSIFGKYSGWAHTVLFASDLRQHKEIHLLE